MIEMFNGVSGEMIGLLTEFQLDDLLDHISDGSGLETYTINRDTLDYLSSSGIDPKVIEMLDSAMKSRRELKIQFHILDEADVDFGAEEEEEE